jgi:hypothetical protein
MSYLPAISCHGGMRKHEHHIRLKTSAMTPFSELSEFKPFCPRPGFQERLGHMCLTLPNVIFQNFAEFFAELCAEEAPIVPLRSSLLR